MIPIPSHWWLEEDNVLKGEPLHPLKHALQIFTDASKEWWGIHLTEHTARGDWPLPESKLHISYLELKAAFLALKEFYLNNTVFIATDSTTVVAYINKEGGMKSGLLCALMWRILTLCTRKQVILKAQHIPGQLNVMADRLSKQNGLSLQSSSKQYAPGGTSPKWFCPNLTRSLTIISCYVNPHRSLYLMEALHQLFNKNAVEPVTTQIVWVLQETFSSYKT